MPKFLEKNPANTSSKISSLSTLNLEPTICLSKFRKCCKIICIISYAILSLALKGTNQFSLEECGEQAIIEPIFVIKDDIDNIGKSQQYYASKNLPRSNHVRCPKKLAIEFSGFEQRFSFDLVNNNQNLINFRDQSDILNKKIENHIIIDTKKLDDHLNKTNHCHYINEISKYDIDGNKLSAMTVVNDRLLSGLFSFGPDHIFYLQPNLTDSTTILSRKSTCNKENKHKSKNVNQYEKSDHELVSRIDYSQHYHNGSIPITSGKIQRTSRSIKKNRRSTKQNLVKHGPFMSNSTSLYVDLLIVHDTSQFVKYKGNTTFMTERTMQIVNIMNAFYRQLNIFIALVGVVFWVDKDEITLTDDGDATLKEFLKYRYEKLLPIYHHDNAQLLTDTKFKDEVVGKAFRGPMCTYEHSGGVNKDHAASPAVVAVTLAHELGHNFGMEHDNETRCRCPDEKCIMAAKSSEVHPKSWSSCSIEYLEDARKHGLLDCLIDEPERILGPICGNGFVEDGEDCDMGEPIPSHSRSRKGPASLGIRSINKLALNHCCDATTCKFVGNATCAQGPCCDLSSCTIYNGTESKICRARRNECDLEEICDGKSEYCPQDVHYHDGIECSPSLSIASNNLEPEKNSLKYNRSRAYCYDGKCASHESQCQLLWGPTGTASADICFDQNTHGNTSGNCGFNRREKNYEGCRPEDVICGMLHCGHEQEGVADRKHGKLAYGFESASILTMSYFISGNRGESQCFGAIIDAGPSVRDPGMVPNGASCGDDKICMNQKCLPLYDVVYANWCPSDCNGNGICDNQGVCHCNDGTIGTSCYQFFGPNFHLSLLLYIIGFFVPMIALIVVTLNYYKDKIKLWWFLQNRKRYLKQQARQQPQAKQERRTIYSVNDSSTTIFLILYMI